jgi:hypothetical protein
MATKHINQYVSRPRDPDARSEAVSFCGEREECSGSGKHGQVDRPEDSNCERCKVEHAVEMKRWTE